MAIFKKIKRKKYFLLQSELCHITHYGSGLWHTAIHREFQSCIKMTQAQSRFYSQSIPQIQVVLVWLGGKGTASHFLEMKWHKRQASQTCRSLNADRLSQQKTEMFLSSGQHAIHHKARLDTPHTTKQNTEGNHQTVLYEHNKKTFYSPTPHGFTLEQLQMLN